MENVKPDETSPTDEQPFVHEVTIRYLEVDQQGVVNNTWYLAYVDDAMTAFLDFNGLPYQALLDAGYDCQVVNAQLTWKSGLRWGAPVRIEVRLIKLGATSFTLGYNVTQRGELVARVEIVYVCIATNGDGKQPLPPILLGGLGTSR